MEASGQNINADKLEIFFINTSPETTTQICKITGYKQGSFTYKYLGINLDKTHKNNKDWLSILDKMDTKIGGWRDRWLTKMGKAIKIKVVLSTLPTYPLSCLHLSNIMNQKIVSKLRNFFWDDIKNQKNKRALIKWEELCKPKELGGLGFKNMLWHNQALGVKLAWRLCTERNKKWAKILYNKYLNPENPTSLFRMRKLPMSSES